MTEAPKLATALGNALDMNLTWQKRYVHLISTLLKHPDGYDLLMDHLEAITQ